ncbi:MAG: hypothetical protein NTX82_03495 [Candidatus Parcubacteria bacterium]|nr:hypothetical protein [Candidatus Parcubacteria bacterium]
MKKFILITISSLLIIILALLIVRLLGYSFNKDFLSFNKQQCISKNQREIEGCTFWMRVNYLEKTQGWADLFKKEDAYCSEKYKNENTNIDVYKPLFSLPEMSDPLCNLEAFKDQKRKENWEYLTSKEKDGYYYYCEENKACPRPKLFK